MADTYMKIYNLPEDRSWLMVAENVRNIGIQFRQQGQAHVHIGDVEPDEEDAYILISNITDDQPRTASFGQLPPDAKVWMRRSGAAAPSVTVLAY